MNLLTCPYMHTGVTRSQLVRVPPLEECYSRGGALLGHFCRVCHRFYPLGAPRTPGEKAKATYARKRKPGEDLIVGALCRLGLASVPQLLSAVRPEARRVMGVPTCGTTMRDALARLQAQVRVRREGRKWAAVK